MPVIQVNCGVFRSSSVYVEINAYHFNMKASRRSVGPDACVRAPFVYVHTDAQWACVCSPVQHEVVQFLAALGPCSIVELARAMDAAADGLYHPIKRLVAAGLVRGCGDRHTGRRRERLYDVAAERFRFDVDVATNRNTDRLRAMFRARLEHAERLFDGALRDRRVRVEEPLADTVIDAGCAWLDDDSFQKVQRHLQSALQIMASRRRARAGGLYSLAVAFSPAGRARDNSTRPTKRLAAMASGS